jgi:hypothetical protein
MRLKNIRRDFPDGFLEWDARGAKAVDRGIEHARWNRSAQFSANDPMALELCCFWSLIFVLS